MFFFFVKRQLNVCCIRVAQPINFAIYCSLFYLRKELGKGNWLSGCTKCSGPSQGQSAFASVVRHQKSKKNWTEGEQPLSHCPVGAVTMWPNGCRNAAPNWDSSALCGQSKSNNNNSNKKRKKKKQRKIMFVQFSSFCLHVCSRSRSPNCSHSCSCFIVHLCRS